MVSLHIANLHVQEQRTQGVMPQHISCSEGAWHHVELPAKSLLLGALDTLLLWAGSETRQRHSETQASEARTMYCCARKASCLVRWMRSCCCCHGQALLLHVLLHRRAHRARRVDALLVVLQQLPASHAPAHPQENLYALASNSTMLDDTAGCFHSVLSCPSSASRLENVLLIATGGH